MLKSQIAQEINDLRCEEPYAAHRHSGIDSYAALQAARGLIDRIVLTPAESGIGFDVELVGDITSMISLGLAGSQPNRRAGGVDHDLFGCSVNLVAGVGFEPTTFRL